MFAQLNPYQRYGNGWDELTRQGYTLGDIQGWAASSGTVVIPRATFRAYGAHTGYLACTVAHEIAHIRRHHIFEQSYHVNHNLKGQPEAQKKLGEMKRSREFELEADRLGAEIAYVAGFDPRVGAAFFDRIPDPGDQFLGSHPANADRKRVVAETVAQLGG
jgi:predicted Zn-dependent protease